MKYEGREYFLGYQIDRVSSYALKLLLCSLETLVLGRIGIVEGFLRFLSNILRGKIKESDVGHKKYRTFEYVK